MDPAADYAGGGDWLPGASLRSMSVTPFTLRTAFMTLPRCGRLSTSTKIVPNTEPSFVCKSAPRILVPVWLTASMMSAYRPRRSSPVTASRTANASPAVSCQSMSTRRSSAASVSRFGQSERWIEIPRPCVTYPTTESPGTGWQHCA